MAQVGHTPFAPPSSRPPTLFVPPQSILHSYSAQYPGVEGERMRMAGRHTGLFSSKDVEIGCCRGTWIHYPSPPPTISKKYEPINQFRYIGTQKVSGRALAPEFSVLPGGLAVIINCFSHSVSSRHPMQDPPLSSGTLLDNDSISLMNVTMDIAPSIWESMDILVGEIVLAEFNVSKVSISVKVLAKRLNNNIGSYCGHEGACNNVTTFA